MTSFAPSPTSVRSVFVVYLIILITTVVIAVNQQQLRDWGFLSWVLLAAIGLSGLISLYGLITGRVWSLADPWTPRRIRQTRRSSEFAVLMFSVVIILQLISGVIGSWDVEETLVTGIFAGLLVYMAAMYVWSGNAQRQYRDAAS